MSIEPVSLVLDLLVESRFFLESHFFLEFLFCRLFLFMMSSPDGRVEKGCGSIGSGENIGGHLHAERDDKRIARASPASHRCANHEM